MLKTHAEGQRYKHRIIVAGSRHFSNYDLFSDIIKKHISKYYSSEILFVSGKAKTGADDLIIRFSEEFDFDYTVFPALWNDLTVPNVKIAKRKENGTEREYNLLAGYNRNEEMAIYGTELVLFWNSISNGSKHMLACAKKHMLITKVHLISGG